MATVTSSASRESVCYPCEPIGLRVARPEPSFEQRAIAILSASRPPYRAVGEDLTRRERELGLLFAAVPSADARALQFRLTACRADDALAQAFAHLSLACRGRLLAVLFYVRRPTKADR